MNVVSKTATCCAFAFVYVSTASAVPQSVIAWDVSTDGGSSWQTSVDVLPGATLKFRMRTSLINNTGAGRLPAGGVLGFNLLPSLSNWMDGDSVHAMSTEAYYEGSSRNPLPNPLPGPYPLPAGTFHGSGVTNGGNGRQAPFGANGTNVNGVPVPQVVGSDLHLVASIIGNSGVSFSQLPSGLSSVYAWDGHTYLSSETGDIVVDPPAAEIAAGLWSQYSTFAGSFFRNGVTDVPLFVYTVTLDASNTSDRVLVQSSPAPTDVVYGPSIGVVPTSKTLAPENLVMFASVHVVPGPGGSALLLAGAMGATRRRRAQHRA